MIAIKNNEAVLWFSSNQTAFAKKCLKCDKYAMQINAEVKLIQASSFQNILKNYIKAIQVIPYRLKISILKY